MDVPRALTYTFHDPRWGGKLGIAMLLNLLPVAVNLLQQQSSGGMPLGVASLGWGVVIGLATIPIYGYVLRITRNVVDGSDLPLPGWQDGAGILRDGLTLWGVLFLWGIPSALLSIVAPEPGQWGNGLLLTLVLGVVALAVFVVQPAAEARLAATKSFAAGIDVPTVLGIVRRNAGRYLRLMLFVLIVGGLAFAVVAGVVWLVMGATGHSPGYQETVRLGATVFQALVGPYTSFVLYHLYGQVYRQAIRR